VLRLEVGKYRARLVEVEQAVRIAAAERNQAAVAEALVKLAQVNQDWLTRQTEAAAQLRERIQTSPEVQTLGASLENVLLGQVSQIESTTSNLAQLDLGEETQAGCQRVIGELCRLVDLAHALRDRMHDALLAIMRQEGRIAALDKRFQVDSLTGLFNRTGLEAVFCEWWRDDPSRKRQLSIGLVDVDKLGRSNHSVGVLTTDKLLRAFADVLANLIRKDRGYDTVARFDGQRFVLFFGDTGPRNATSAVERIRQNLVQSEFQHAEAMLHLTVSVGVTEVLADDTTDSIFARLHGAVLAAKREGRNCTFLDEGHGPQLTTPPKYEVKERVVRLE